jgi:hypothetical protein
MSMANTSTGPHHKSQCLVDRVARQRVWHQWVEWIEARDGQGFDGNLNVIGRSREFWEPR